MQFRRYRKTTLIEARQLSKQDYIHRRGVIHTLEGPAAFKPGDYLARDHKGQWPISRARMERTYRRVSAPDRQGWARWQSLEIREACQMSKPFTVGGLRGKAGDYLVRGDGHAWPVNQELFRTTYTSVE
jgi:hypothetical protein